MRKKNNGSRKLKRITMIGPVYPYKSGIAHYTGLLCNALRKKYEVEMLSFKFQYPAFLFRQEQKDFSSRLFAVENTQYLIHTANPFNIIRNALKIRKSPTDLVILQWWHPYFAPCYLLLLWVLRRTPVFFICHNVFPHERFPFDRKLTELVLKKGSGFIVQSGTDGEDLRGILPDCRCITAVHPTYGNFRHSDMTKEQAREQLALEKDGRVLLFFGFVKEYKGLGNLLNAMPRIVRSYPDVKLLIAGEFDGNKEEYMTRIEDLGIRPYIELADRFIPDGEVEPWFAACDLVILPYESATQSGIVQMAYGFERPVVVTEVGGLPDVVRHGKTGYVVLPHAPDKIAEAVEDYYGGGREVEFRDNIRQEAKRFSWDRMVEHIETLWEELQEKSR